MPLPTKIRASVARTSVFQLTRMLRSCSRSKTCRRIAVPRVHASQRVLPAQAHPSCAGDSPARSARRDRVRASARRSASPVAVCQHRGKIASSAASRSQLVADRQLDIDALDGVRVLAQALERNHHVLIDLEGVGMLGDGRGLGAIQPELAPRLRAHRDESFAGAGVGQTHHMRGGRRHRVRVLADDIAQQHHFWQGAALRFGAVADRAQIALVQMLEAGQQRAAESWRSVSR